MQIHTMGLTGALLLWLFFLGLPSYSSAQEKKSWRNADRSSVGIAPLPTEEPRAMVQIYFARAYSWRGYFAIHPWITYKQKNASHYTTHQVMGFGVERGVQVIRSHNDLPDRRWFGNDPSLMYDIRGDKAEEMIPHIEKAVASYAYPDSYRIFPGPNSNTFISHVIRNTPGIYVEMPPHAIGKDWIGTGQPLALSETRTGVQFSIFGLFGFTLGLAEGIEINILGMNFGIDILRPALKLPFIGRVGFEDRPVFGDSVTEKIDNSHIGVSEKLK